MTKNLNAVPCKIFTMRLWKERKTKINLLFLECESCHIILNLDIITGPNPTPTYSFSFNVIVDLGILLTMKLM